MEAHFSVVKIPTWEEEDGPLVKLGFIDLSFGEPLVVCQSGR
jgi:hypothetical protein